MQNTLAVLLTEKNNAKLNELTAIRSVSALPIGGRYRLIDFMLSNMVNSGILNIGVCTKANYSSLMDHIGTGKPWDLNRKRKGLFMLFPYTSREGTYNSDNDIDILHNISSYLIKSTEKYVIIALCNKVFNFSFNDAIKFHIEKKADITMLYYETSNKSKINYKDTLETNEDGKVLEIMANTLNSKSKKAYMDIAIIEKSLLLSLINECVSKGKHSFLMDILIKKMSSLNIYGYEYKGYLGIVDDINSYYKNNMNLLNEIVRNELFCSKNLIYTKVKDKVPTKYEKASKTSNCLIADGCIIEGEVENSIIFRGVKISKNAKITNSIIMQNSIISENSIIENAILDKEVFIKNGKRLTGQENYPIIVEKRKII